MSPNQDQLQDELNKAERVAKVAREILKSSLTLSARLAATVVAMGFIASIIGTDNFQQLEQLIGSHPNLAAFIRESGRFVSLHPWLTTVVATIAPNLLASLWDRIAFNSKTSDKQIEEFLLTALSGTETEKKIVEFTKKGTAKALTEYGPLKTEEFYHAISRLVRRMEEQHNELLQEYQTPTNFVPTFPITNSIVVNFNKRN